MNHFKYNLINGPKKTVTDYLQTLDNDDLQTIYSSTLFYNLKMPGLIRKMQSELEKRKINSQLILF
ncbi:MAG: hypothetical protein U0T74_06135 [Chitinophagales bacterium]